MILFLNLRILINIVYTENYIILTRIVDIRLGRLSVIAMAIGFYVANAVKVNC